MVGTPVGPSGASSLEAGGATGGRSSIPAVEGVPPTESGVHIICTCQMSVATGRRSGEASVTDGSGNGGPTAVSVAVSSQAPPVSGTKWMIERRWVAAARSDLADVQPVSISPSIDGAGVSTGLRSRVTGAPAATRVTVCRQSAIVSSPCRKARRVVTVSPPLDTAAGCAEANSPVATSTADAMANRNVHSRPCGRRPCGPLASGRDGVWGGAWLVTISTSPRSRRTPRG